MDGVSYEDRKAEICFGFPIVANGCEDHQKFDYVGCKCFAPVFTLKLEFYNARQLSLPLVILGPFHSFCSAAPYWSYLINTEVCVEAPLITRSP